MHRDGLERGGLSTCGRDRMSGATRAVTRSQSVGHGRVAAVFSLVVLTACQARPPGFDAVSGISADIQQQRAFTCTHESARIPPRDPEAEQLYKHARWLARQNILKEDPAAYPPIERLLRIATALGHDRANIELRDMLDKGQVQSADPGRERMDLVQDLIDRGIPAGYYDMGWYLENGFGVKRDVELAFRYYRKAADLGSPEGQYLVGDRLSDMSKNGKAIASIGWAMYRCAADQLHSDAALEFAIHQRSSGAPADGFKYFQAAASAGEAMAASSLADAFSIKDHADPIWGLGMAPDPAREARYKRITEFLSAYSYLNPKVPEINEIVPPPPAKLPAWDGKFKWQEEHVANIPPPLPSEARIEKMARSKGLDSKSGRRLKPVV